MERCTKAQDSASCTSHTYVCKDGQRRHEKKVDEALESSVCASYIAASSEDMPFSKYISLRRTISSRGLQRRLISSPAAHRVRVGYDLVVDVGVVSPCLLIYPIHCTPEIFMT